MSTSTWTDVMANPCLKALPFKIELNKWDRIEMSPARSEQGRLQWIVALDGNRRVIRA